MKIYIQEFSEYNRNSDIFKCFDFVDSCEYAIMNPGHIMNGMSRNATVTKKNGKQERLDYYFCLSDILTRGHRVETFLPECDTDWALQLVTEKPKGFEIKRPMVVLFPSSEGLAKAWLNGFEKEQWADLINRLIKLGMNPVIIGAKAATLPWDDSHSESIIKLLDEPDKCLSMVGKTNLPEVLYLLKHADIVIGAISGMTILANHFRTPTIALRPNKSVFSEEFTHTWTAPGYKDYISIESNANIADGILNKVKEWSKRNHIKCENKVTVARIGVLPGIGDIYWCLLKLEDYKKKNKIDKLVLYVYDSTNIKDRNYNRAGRLLDLVNFVDEYHYIDFFPKSESEALKHFADTARVRDGLAFFDTSIGRILFMYPNAYVDKGKRIEEWMPEYKTNFGMEIKTKSISNIKQFPLILVCSLDEKTCNTWLNGFGKEEWAGLVENIAKRYKTKPVVIGAEWDKPFTDSWLSLLEKNTYIDLVGKISFEETCGLFKRANLLISTISGASIVANHFKTPTIALSPSFFHGNGFTHSWIRPGYKKYYSIDAFKYMDNTIIYLSDILLGKILKVPKKIMLGRVYPKIGE